jgi:hypothetical protein
MTFASNRYTSLSQHAFQRQPNLFCLTVNLVPVSFNIAPHERYFLSAFSSRAWRWSSAVSASSMVNIYLRLSFETATVLASALTRWYVYCLGFVFVLEKHWSA